MSGVMTWSIEPAGGGSKITLTYSVGGVADRPLADWAPLVDEMLGGQLKRLARYVSQGSPEAPKNEQRALTSTQGTGAPRRIG